MSSRLRVLLVYAQSNLNATFSYQHAWPRHFCAHPRLACTPLNLADRRLRARIEGPLTARFGQYDAIVLLHSTFSNSCYLGGRLFDAIRRAPQPKAFFIGNEYKLMPEKMAFAEALGIALLVSQSSSPAVHDRYRQRLRCAVIGLPNTGLDSGLFFPRTAYADRRIDLGYRSVPSPYYLGHNERERLAGFFANHRNTGGLIVDVSLEAGDRFDEPGWAEFLNRCRGQLGTEAGGDYFELTDETRLRVNAFLETNQTATFQDVFDRFFATYESPQPLRIISGRNIEAAGTRTVQILFEGHYDGYLHPGVHYIPLKKDLSNAAEAMLAFRDADYAQRVANNAFELAMTEFRYDVLIGKFHEAFAPLVA